MLPKISPLTEKTFKECSVVGNGGILQNSSCGSEIDHADFVFRLNLPPLIPTEDIGTNVDVVTANPSILTQKFQSLNEYRKPFIDMIKTYDSAFILMPAFSYEANIDISFKVLYSLEDFGLHKRVIFFHPEYLKNLSLYWKKKGLKVKRLSSGLMLVSAAIELCEKVTLYGFWPFSKDLQGNTISHHYYDNMTPVPGIHSMSDEFYHYVQMHIKKSIYLRLGKC
ncbi:alpha-2,8-sialyltransferase 8F-like [Discoglossus pictus]